MASKAPKKEKSRERVGSALQKHSESSGAYGGIPPIAEKDERGRKVLKQPIPVWPEWTDQDIASEKWDSGHKGRTDAKGRSPNASVHSFEDIEGRLDLPRSLRDKVHSWRRPQDFISDGKTPVVVDMESVRDRNVDLLSANDHISDSEYARWIISNVTALWKFLNQGEGEAISCSLLKTKPSKDMKEPKESKTDKGKKDGTDGSQIFDEMTGWKPWQHIWPKESSQRFTTLPTFNPGGKYCIKLFWMGCWRKVTVDDLMPFDEEGKLLLPATTRDNEIWSLLLSKAFIKIASLDYAGGLDSCEFGESNIIHCLTGWLPEPIPLKYGNTTEIWKLLLKVLPNWKLPPPPSNSESLPNVHDKENHKSLTDEEQKKEEQPSKQDSKESGKEQKDGKGKKEEKDGGVSMQGKEKTNKGMDKQKEKGHDKQDKDGKGKDKGTATASNSQVKITQPEFFLMASYSHPPKTPLKVSTLREMADASEKLRVSGLSHNHPHPVLLTMARNCLLVAPPVPIPIPRWKLIRKKRKTQTVEPPLHPKPPKEPKFVELSSPFVNYRVSPIPVSRAPTPVKWDKFRPKTPMGSVIEEGDKDFEEEETSADQAEGETIEGGDKANDLDSNDKKENVNSEDESGQGKGKPQLAEDIKVEQSKVSRKMSSTARVLSASKRTASLKNDSDTLDKKSNRKLSISSARSEQSGGLGSRDGSAKESAKGRRISKMERPDAKVAERMEKDTKDGKDPKKLMKDAQKDIITSLQVSEIPADGDVQKSGDDKTVKDGEQESNEKEQDKAIEEDQDNEKNSKKQLWMEYDDFCHCFGTLWIFHKPNTYTYFKGHSDLKSPEIKTDKSRKSVLNPTASIVAATPSGRNQSISSSPYGSHLPYPDPPPPYLFVDSLTSVELLVSLSSFSRWFDPNAASTAGTKEKDRETTHHESTPSKEITHSAPTPGILIAEPYSWKSLVTGNPSLRIRTTGIKGAVLTLPPGRHVLRFLIQAPLGYRVDICSQTPFVFGDEDLVMYQLTKESCRFVQHSVETLQKIGEVISSFQDPSLQSKRDWVLTTDNHSPSIAAKHFQALMKSFRETLKAELNEGYESDMQFSMEALKFAGTQHLKNRNSILDIDERRSSDVLEIGRKSTTPVQRNLTMPLQSEAINEEGKEDIAAVKIQAQFRGHLVRLLRSAQITGTDENNQVNEQLSKAWALIESNMESFSVQMYRAMFKLEPSLLQYFPFCKDEWTRIAFSDYNGSYQEQPVNSWFVVFRDVFFVQEPVLVVPKLYINIPSCVLRIINNDSDEELPRVFMRVAPRIWPKNKNGYTVVAEARSSTVPVPVGKFRLRLIGSAEPLPSPIKEGTVNTHFTTKEIRDYYLPNRYNVIFRYSVKVTDDHLVSIQFKTSKNDVYVKLEILDEDVVVAKTEGKGQAVIPAFIFQKDILEDEEEKGSRQDSGRSSVKGNRGNKGGKRPVSPAEKPSKKTKHASYSQSAFEVSSDRTGPTDSHDNIDHSLEETAEPQVHKYIIQAQVLRNSWPLSKSQWDFVMMLKQMEKDGEALPDTSTKTEKHSAGPKRKGKTEGKDGRTTSRTHQATTGSRPSSQFDSSKPNWILRVVSDARENEIELKKDTERQDEIKAMKAAWEAAEPGRAAKAQQTRMKFLSENMIRVEKEQDETKEPQSEDQQEKTENAETAVEAVTSPASPGASIEYEPSELTLVPPVKEQDMVLRRMDLQPYIRSSGKCILLDSAEEERIQLEREVKLREYKMKREKVLQDREEDRIQRNLEKEKQLQEYEEMQAHLDEARRKLHCKREAYRQKFLEQPEAEVEADTGKRKKSPTSAKGRKSKSPRSKSPKGKSKSPPKAKKK